MHRSSTSTGGRHLYKMQRLASAAARLPNVARPKLAGKLTGPFHAIPLAAPLPAFGALRRFSTEPTESERVHGKINAERVVSKAMKRKLRAEEVERDAATAPVYVAPPPSEPAPLPPQYQQQQMQQWQQAPQYGQPVSFGQTMKQAALMGFGMSLAFILVRAVLGF